VKRIGKLGILLIIVGAVCFMGYALFRAPKPELLPNPNGYDDFLRAAPMVTAKVEDFPDLDREALRALLETNGEPLHVLRLGLTRQCAVPTALWGNSGQVRFLAMLLAAEGRQRELDDQPSEAAHSYVDCIHLGCNVSQGGVVIDRLVGVAFESIGRNTLVKLIPKLRREQIQPLIRELEQINSNEVSWTDVLHNEHRFIRIHMFESPNPITWVQELLLLLHDRQLHRAAKEMHDLTIAQLRLLIAEIALRCYTSEQGQAPLRLDELVPKYLQQVPSDPFSANPLVYRPQGTNWLLYSVGLDRMDHGGKRSGRIYQHERSNPTNSGDLFYDSPW